MSTGAPGASLPGAGVLDEDAGPPLRIAFVTSEMAPFAKAGGLGDVSAALPRALAGRGHDVRVFLPLYAQARAALAATGARLEPVAEVQEIPLRFGARVHHFSLLSLAPAGSGATIHLVDCPELYTRRTLYTLEPDEAVRFLLLTRAVIESCQRLRFAPDVFHVNDWPSALLPLYLRTIYGWDRLLHGSRTLLTIHNLGYQGVFTADLLSGTGLLQDAHLFHQEDLRAGRINLLKIGLHYATRLSTVSPTYAREIQTAEMGFGLDPVLRWRARDLVGILNGADYDTWDPRIDPHLPARYGPDSLEKKEESKRALLARVGLPYAEGVPVVGAVSRLAGQKGFDLAAGALPDLLARCDLRLVVLGSGEERFERWLEALALAFPGKVRHETGFQDDLAHLIEAGSDLYLMPSLYEPCGLNQMYSLRYGTVPVVRRTGGLADTVTPWDAAARSGTGFVFGPPRAEALRAALGEALDAYEGDRDAWRAVQRNGMREDFSWHHAAARYEALYRETASG